MPNQISAHWLHWPRPTLRPHSGRVDRRWCCTEYRCPLCSGHKPVLRISRRHLHGRPLGVPGRPCALLPLSQWPICQFRLWATSESAIWILTNILNGTGLNARKSELEAGIGGNLVTPFALLTGRICPTSRDAAKARRRCSGQTFLC